MDMKSSTDISIPQSRSMDDEIDLREYLAVINRYKWAIVSFIFSISLFALLILFSMEPVYKSEAIMLIESESANVVSIEEVYGLPGGNKEYYQTQFEIMASRSIAERVVDRLSLWNHADFSLQKKPFLGIDWQSWLSDGSEEKVVATEKEKRKATIGKFPGRLEITPVRNSYLVKISFESHDPVLAAKVANTVADEYITSVLEARLQMTEKAAVWLTQRLESLRIKLELSEKKLQAYKEREKLVDVQGVKSLTVKRLDAITTGLVEARRKRAETKVLYRQVRTARTRGSSLHSLPAVLQHSLVQAYKRDVSGAERKLSELGKRYGGKHPRIIQLKSDLKTARNNLYRQVQNVIAGVQKNYEVAQANVRGLEREMSSSKKEVQGIGKKQYQLGVLQREVDANQQLFDMFLTRFKETSETGGLNRANARVVDSALVPTTPFKPHKKNILMITALLSGVVAVFLVFLYERLDNTVKRSTDIEEKLGLPVLGILQKLKTKGRQDRSPLRAFVDDDQTNFAEAIRTIRTGVLLSALDESHKIIVVTSSIPGEGKSTVAMNLAYAMSHVANVLLIDADMRRPSIADACALSDRSKGLSQFTAGTAKISQAVHQIPGMKLHVMPAGIIPPNPLELLSSNKFKDALVSLSKAFDHIIIDSAPALAVSDALVLSSHASSVIYVVQADSTPLPMVQSGVKRLRQVGASVLGVVLNKVAAGKKGRYGYYGDYYADYSYDR